MKHFFSAVLALLSSAAATAQTQVPLDDNCPPLITLPDNANYIADNFVGTPSPVAPMLCGTNAGATDVWFAYQPSCSGRVWIAAFPLFGSQLVVEVRDSACGGCGGTPLACAFGVPGLRVEVQPSHTYYVRIGGDNAGNAQFFLGMTCEATGTYPADDEPNGATPVVLGANSLGILDGFNSLETSLPWSCGLTTTVGDRWFVFTAQCTAPHTFRTCGSGLDTRIELFDVGPVFPAPCPAWTSLGCNDDSCGIESSVTANLTLGHNYLARVGTITTIGGNLTLTVSTGTNTGNSALMVASTCRNATTFAVAGDLNIGGFVQATMAGHTGFPIVGYGFAPNLTIPAPCGCQVISDGFGGLGTIFFGASLTLPIPCDPTLIGAQATMQGIDVFPPAPSCVFVGLPFAATDIHLVTIG